MEMKKKNYLPYHDKRYRLKKKKKFSHIHLLRKHQPSEVLNLLYCKSPFIGGPLPLSHYITTVQACQIGVVRKT